MLRIHATTTDDESLLNGVSKRHLGIMFNYWHKVLKFMRSQCERYCVPYVVLLEYFGKLDVDP